MPDGLCHPDDDPLALFAAVAEASSDAIVVTDAAGMVRGWNPRAAALFGYTADEVRGRSVRAVLGTDDSAFEALRLSALAAESPRSLPVTLRSRDGGAIHVSMTTAPVQGRAGGPSGAVLIARDLTDVRKDERERRATESRWRAVIDSAVDGIVVIDAAGRIETFNSAAERLFGYAEADVVGRNVSMLMPSPYREEHDGYLARYLRDGVRHVIGIGREVTGARRDGTLFPLHLAIGETSVDGERKFTGILHDLSERVRMEAQLREQEALAKLGEMAAVIAHEVKNPLAGIRGAVQVIGSRMPADSSEARIAGEIVARVDALTDLVKDLLLFARPPSPKPVPTELAPLIALTADLLRTDPALSRVHVRVEGSAPPVLADAGLLRIVFLNLLMNGAHAMQGRGTIDVSITATTDACVVAIRDGGPGIPPVVRDKVFTPFFTTKSRGTGLGLPTARRIIDAHRGRIRLECPESGGTTAIVELPVRPSVHDETTT